MTKTTTYSINDQIDEAYAYPTRLAQEILS